MSIKVQSSNITNLYAELGFGKDFPGREARVLALAVTGHPLEALSQGHPLPLFKADSPEAHNIALRFCETNQRGRDLWPDGAHRTWPSWSLDRSKILGLVAHVFSLQAYHKYQGECRSRKSKMTPQLKASAIILDRELSPLSQKLVVPPPPRGTASRPAMGGEKKISPSTSRAFIPSMAQSNNTSNETDISQYFQHVRSLNPKADDFKSLTKSWLVNVSSGWPVSADSKVYRFMHENHFYDPEYEDSKPNLMIKLAHLLREGTEIKTLAGGDEYNNLTERTLDRVTYLAKSLHEKEFLKHQNGKLEMVKEFKNIWQSRLDIWQQMDNAGKISTTSKNASIYDIDDDDVKGQLLPLSLKKVGSVKIGKRKTQITMPRQSQSMHDPINKTNHTRAKPTLRRKADDAQDKSNSYNSPYPSKRQKFEPSKSALRESLDRSSIESNTGSLEGTAFQVDAQADDNIKIVEDTPRSPTMTARPETPGRSSITQNPPLTPTSLSATTSPLANQINSFSALGLSNPLAEPSGLPNHVTSPGSATRRNNPEIFLTFQNSDLTFDLDYSMPASELRVSSLSTFFKLFSQKSGATVDSLVCLTFRFSFAVNIEVIYKDGREEDFENFKGKIKRLFQYARTRNPRALNCEIWVEIGDTRDAAEEDEDLGGL